jgi:hypothetical protein
MKASKEPFGSFEFWVCFESPKFLKGQVYWPMTTARLVQWGAKRHLLTHSSTVLSEHQHLSFLRTQTELCDLTLECLTILPCPISPNPGKPTPDKSHYLVPNHIHSDSPSPVGLFLPWIPFITLGWPIASARQRTQL